MSQRITQLTRPDLPGAVQDTDHLGALVGGAVKDAHRGEAMHGPPPDATQTGTPRLPRGADARLLGQVTHIRFDLTEETPRRVGLVGRDVPGDLGSGR